MTTIPTKDDGSPDWERMFKDAEYSLRQCGYTALHPDQIRIGYIAGLERCAQLCETEKAAWLKEIELGYTEEKRGHGYPSIYQCRRRAAEHGQNAATIRQWIEKEKQG